MTDADKGLGVNSQHFWNDPANTRIRIIPESTSYHPLLCWGRCFTKFNMAAVRHFGFVRESRGTTNERPFMVAIFASEESSDAKCTCLGSCVHTPSVL